MRKLSDQLAILNEMSIRMTLDAFDQFVLALDSPGAVISEKMLQRLSRRAPWLKTN